MTKTLIYTLLTAFVIIVSLALPIWKFLTKRNSRHKETKSQQASRQATALNKRYYFYKEFFLTRKHILTVNRQVSRLAVYSARDCRVTTAQFFEQSFIIALGLIILVAIVWHNLIAVLLAFGLAMVLESQLVIAKVTKVDTEILKALRLYTTSFLDAYTNFGSIPLALREAQCPPILQNRIDAIYQIVTGDNGRGRLNIFLQETTNRTLKTLAVACYCHNESGDSDDTSKFKSVVRMIKEELDVDYSIEIRRAIMYRGLTFLPLIPLIAFPGFKLIMKSILPGTQTFYVSQAGYLCEVITLVVCLFCYYVISNLNNASVAKTDDRISFIVKLMQRPKVLKFAKTLVSKKFSKRRALRKKIDGCLSSKTLEYVAFEQFLFGIVFVCFGVIATFLILITARSGIKTTLVSPSMTTNLTYTDSEYAKMLAYDDSILKLDKLPTDAEIYKSVRAIMRKENDTQLSAQVERVKLKYKSYHAVRFNWWFAFIYIGLYYLGHYVPMYLLQLRVKLVASEAEIDVLQLQTIIAVLMATTLDTHSVLYWLMQTSDTHRALIEKCYYNFWKDPYDAVRQMKRKASIPEFRALCDRLLNTVYVCSIEEAFQDLIADRSLTLDIRKVKLLDAMQIKRGKVSKFAYSPTLVCIISTILMPLITVMATSLTEIQEVTTQ